MILRAATPDDVEPVTALDQRLFGADAWSTTSVAEELTGPRRRSVVAVDDGAVVGYAVLLVVGESTDLQRIAVTPEHRRRGVARRLLDAVRAEAHSSGAHELLLEVGAANEPALAFYAAEGFEEIDRRPRYYRDGSDALVLRAPVGTQEAAS